MDVGGMLLQAILHAVTQPVILLTILLVAAIKVLPHAWEQYRYAKSDLPQVDAMSGYEFEKYLENLFNRLGYRVVRTQYKGDFGADLVLMKNGQRFAVQAKRWSKDVGIKAVQEVVGSKAHYRCERAMVVTNRGFTRAARQLAAENGVVLWDRQELGRAMQRAGRNRADAAAPAEQAERDAGESAPHACPRCGHSLVMRSGARGRFWGCSSYPRCRYTRES